nr:reverse transcriptase domain-containing protein [Tanacetum cinerariifolium]
GLDEHPITFSLVSAEDVSKEPLIIEAEVEGYLVRRVYVDEEASVEVIFEYGFENLSPTIKARLKDTQTELVGFSKEVTKLLGKIELEVWIESVKIYSLYNPFNDEILYFERNSNLGNMIRHHLKMPSIRGEAND